MATRTVSNAGGNWNATTAWVGGVVPIAGDDVNFTATSGNLTVNVSTAILSGIDFTNYVNTITFNNTIQLNTNLNLGTGGYTQAGASGLRINADTTISGTTIWTRTFLMAANAAVTLTLSNNLNLTDLSLDGNAASLTFILGGNVVSISNNISFTGNGSYTLNIPHDLQITNLIIGNGGNRSCTINGLFTLSISGNLTQNQGISPTSGTASIVLNGTGTWSNASTGILQNNVTINTAGTITFGTNVRYSIGTFTHIAGNVITTGSTFTTDTNATLNTNGTAIVFNNFLMNGANAILTLTTDLYCNQFSMGVNNKTINGANIYNGGSLASPSNTGNVQGTSTIIMNGTGTISSAGGSYFGIDITINTTGTTTLGTTNYGLKTFKYLSGNVVSTGTFTLVQASSTLDTSGMTFNNISSGTGSNITLASPLTATGNLSIAAGHALNFVSPTYGFTVGGLSVAGTGTLILAVGPTYTVTTNMATTTATLAARGLIRCVVVNGAKAILNLNPGATQDNGYISATDIDSSGGRSIWTYKGVLTRTVNWNQLSSNPKKHVLSNKNRILKN